MMISQAVANAIENRSRVAVMLFGFSPQCAGARGVHRCPHAERLLSERIGQQPDEWAPVRLDNGACAVIAGGFRSSSAVIERGRALLADVSAGCSACDAARRGCAVGIGMFPEDGTVAEELLRRAEAALDELRLLNRHAAALSLPRARWPTGTPAPPAAGERPHGRAFGPAGFGGAVSGSPMTHSGVMP